MTPGPRDRDTVIALARQLCAGRAGGVAGLLAPQAALVVDNGGDTELGVSAVGRLAAAAELTRIVARVPARTISLASLNGSCGVVVHGHGAAAAILVPTVRHGVIAEVWAVVAPDKLAGWSGPSAGPPAPTRTPEG
jgi:hypothetical protein